MSRGTNRRLWVCGAAVTALGASLLLWVPEDDPGTSLPAGDLAAADVSAADPPPNASGVLSGSKSAEAPADVAAPDDGVPDEEPEQAPEEASGAPGHVAGSDPTDAQVLEDSEGQLVAANVPAATGPEAPAAVASSLWWEWTASEDESVTFDTHGSEFDTVLTIAEKPDSGKPIDVAANDDDGDVTTSTVTFDAEKDTTYLVQVESKHDDPGLVTLAWYTAPAVAAPMNASYSSIPISANTGEKPQSKVWEHDGTWWAVLGSRAVSPRGAWLWKLQQNGTWTNILHLSNATDVRGDALHVGDTTHILFHGPSSHLVSIQYDSANGTYEPWSSRPGPTPVSLPGSETATIAIDSTGRMWLAADAPNRVNVYYSDAPYSSFSGPVSLATNITDDDIATVTTLPNNSVGVFWSNQNTKRFGFRTHVDGTAPGRWTADEVPAGGSAQPTGGGMADDHVNVAVASDGTLYAAVKTSYNSSSRPVVALLVRRPNGTWDPLYEVDRQGTRPIVLLNEQEQAVRVLYTEEEYPDDISWKTSSTQSIDFDERDDVMDGDYNNVTSTKENWTGRVLVLASTPSHAHHAFVEAAAAPGVPTAVASEVTTTQDADVTDRLSAANTSGAALTFQVVTAPATGSVQLTDAATGDFTYTPATGAVGTDTFTFRVREDGAWSEPASVTVTVTPVDGARGIWALDEGGGTTAGDASGLENHGTVRGAPTWVDRAGAPALLLDGTTDEVIVPDHPSLDLTGSMTVAAWIRPEQSTTQYVVKKAASGVDGFELGLSAGSSSSSQKAFVRFNQSSSGNTYRADSTTTYPADGQSWIHVAATYDGTTIRLYVDGDLQRSIAGPASIEANDLDLVIGGQPGGTGRYGGAVDDVRLYDHPLSAQQVADLAYVPVPPTADDGSLSVPAGEAADGTLSASGTSGGPLTFEIVDQPDKGSVTITDAATGAYTYAPNTGAVGTDTFTFRVREENLWSSPGTVTVAVEAAPVPGALGLWAFDEGSGSTATDHSGLGNHGAIAGSPTWVSRAGGTAVRLNGSSQQIAVPDHSSLDISGPMTLAAWIRPERATTQYVVKKASGSVGGFELGLSASTSSSAQKVFVRFNQADSGNTYRLDSTTTYPADGQTWMHVAATYDGTTMRLYINGVEQATGTGPAAIDTNNLDLTIGAQPDNTGRYRGAIDDVHLYDHALTPTQITDLASS